MNTRVLAQTKPAVKSVIPPVRSNPLQRKCACGGTPGPSGECEECRRKRLQRKIRNPKSEIRNDSLVPPIVHEVLRSPGQPLDPATRAFIEPRFGHDFSQVRIHTDARAAESARAVNAHAYTVGQHVVFASGQYQPATIAGQRLLAHELTHVIQQDTSDVPRRLKVDTAGERQAEAVADSAQPPRFSVRPGTFRLREKALARQDAGVERSQELHFAHFFGGAAEPEFEAKPECLKSFGVSIFTSTFARIDARRCAFEAPFEVQADFDPRCKCSELEYRQFIRGHITRDPDGKAENRGDLLSDLPLGYLSESYQEDGNARMTPVHYGHRDEPASSNPKSKSRYINARGVVDQTTGCHFEGSDVPGAFFRSDAGEVWDIELNFYGEIQRNRKPIQRRFWTPIKSRFVAPP